MAFKNWLQLCFDRYRDIGLLPPDLDGPDAWLTSSASDLSPPVREDRIKTLYSERRLGEAERELLIGHGIIPADPESVRESGQFYKTLIQKLRELSRGLFQPENIQETWHRPGWCNFPIVELPLTLDNTGCTVLLPRRSDFAVSDVIPAVNALIPSSEVGVYLLVEGQDWYLIVLTEAEREEVSGTDLWNHHTGGKGSSRIVNGDTPERDAVLLPTVSEPSSPDRDTGFLYFFRGVLWHEAGDTNAAWEDWNRADRLGMESALQTAKDIVNRPLVSVKSYLRTVEGSFVPIEEATEGTIEDPRHIEGVIELHIKGTPILTKEEWDDVDQLWSYIVDGLTEIRDGSPWKTYFPDQPLELKFTPAGDKEVRVVLKTADEVRSKTVAMSSFVSRLNEAGIQFFEELKRLSSDCNPAVGKNLDKLNTK